MRIVVPLEGTPPAVLVRVHLVLQCSVLSKNSLEDVALRPSGKGEAVRLRERVVGPERLELAARWG